MCALRGNALKMDPFGDPIWAKSEGGTVKILRGKRSENGSIWGSNLGQVGGGYSEDTKGETL